MTFGSPSLLLLLAAVPLVATAYGMLERVRRARAKRRLADELDSIAMHCAALPVQDPRSAEEILGYDESGVPR